MPQDAIDPRFLDQSGWRPTALQMSIPVDRRGISPEKWLRSQRTYDPRELEAWKIKYAAELAAKQQPGIKVKRERYRDPNRKIIVGVQKPE